MKTDEQLSLSAAAALLGTSRQNVGNKVTRGTFPPADGRITGGDPYWLRSTVLRASIAHRLGVDRDDLAGNANDRQHLRRRLCDAYGLTDDSPLGAQLATLGHLTEEEGAYLDSVLEVS